MGISELNDLIELKLSHLFNEDMHRSIYFIGQDNSIIISYNGLNSKYRDKINNDLRYAVAFLDYSREFIRKNSTYFSGNIHKYSVMYENSNIKALIYKI